MPHRWKAKMHSINDNPKDGIKGAEGGKNVLAKRYPRCYGRYKMTSMRPK